MNYLEGLLVMTQYARAMLIVKKKKVDIWMLSNRISEGLGYEDIVVKSKLKYSKEDLTEEEFILLKEVLK